MNFINRIKTNKRGQKYTSRSTKLANGIMKHYGSNNVPDKMLKLAVYGTNDSLARQRFDIIWITVQHPIDKSYTKKVAILKKNRAKYLHRMPIEEKNRIVFKLQPAK